MYLWVSWQGGVNCYSIAPAPEWEQKANDDKFDLRLYSDRIVKMSSILLGNNFVKIDFGGTAQELLLYVKSGTSKSEDTRMAFNDLTGWISLFLME